MEVIHKWLPQVWAFMNESKVIGGIIIVVGFAILAWLVDLILDRVLTALVRKSKFHLDDAILAVLHRPIWLSIVLVGAITAIQWISPRPPYPFMLTAVLKSLLVLIWAFAINRVVLRIVEDWIAHWRASGRYGTEMIGLGGSIVRLVVLVGGIFLFLSLPKSSTGCSVNLMSSPAYLDSRLNSLKFGSSPILLFTPSSLPVWVGQSQ